MNAQINPAPDGKARLEIWQDPGTEPNEVDRVLRLVSIGDIFRVIQIEMDDRSAPFDSPRIRIALRSKVGDNALRLKDTVDLGNTLIFENKRGDTVVLHKLPEGTKFVFDILTRTIKEIPRT